MLRLNDIRSGSIFIDGVNLTSVPCELIRQSLSVLPQDPLILSGTFRFNIDPAGIHNDQVILSALADIEMLDWVLSRGGLDSPLEASSISSGQQQLLCLARALVNQSRILILDEPTSNVDEESETKMMTLIEDRFQDRTVIAVAHQLRTIRNFDIVVVLEDGKILEYGEPNDLLHKRESRFKELWDLQN